MRFVIVALTFVQKKQFPLWVAERISLAFGRYYIIGRYGPQRANVGRVVIVKYSQSPAHQVIKMPVPVSAPRTLYEKIWDDHVV